jgi:hypothetical protein
MENPAGDRNPCGDDFRAAQELALSCPAPWHNPLQGALRFTNLNQSLTLVRRILLFAFVQ